MSTYSEIISKIGNLRMQDVINICKSQLPTEDLKRFPYRHPELSNGVALLKSEDALNCYISAYGEMHMIKCLAALQNFPFEKIQSTVEIVDWGCGQGIGSMCVHEALVDHDIVKWLKRITLIEPSDAALDRAKLNLTVATKGSITIVPIERYLPTVENNIDSEIYGLDFTYSTVIHIFSNILDVGSIDLLKIAKIVACTDRSHFIICAGPMNGNAYRIEQFCSLFGQQFFFSNINDRKYGRTSDSFYTFTCKTKCFHYNGIPIDVSNLEKIKIPVFDETKVIYSEYDPHNFVQDGIISNELSKLYLILLNQLSSHDTILLKPEIQGDVPDLVVVRPNKGVLIITLIEDEVHNYNSKNENLVSPIEILDTYQKNLIRIHMEGMIEKVIEDGKNLKLIKKMLVCTKCNSATAEKYFGKCSTDNQYTYVYGNELLIDKNLWKSLMSQIYFDQNNPEFDEKIYKSLLNIITPQWHSYREGKFIALTNEQKNLSQSIENKKQKISGVAGAGKTQVLATRAVNAQVRTGGNVLILTYNKTLRNFIRQRINEVRADFFWDKIKIENYHQFFKSQALRCKKRIRYHEFEAYNDEAFFEDCKGQLPKYEAIFIDEVQDYETAWLKILLKYFLTENVEFVVFGDPKQNLYGKPIDSKGDIRLGIIEGLWKQLKKGIRFSNPQITKLAKAFQREFMSQLPTDEFEESVDSEISSNVEYCDLGLIFNIEKLTDFIRNLIKEHHLNTKDTIVLSQTIEILRDLDYDYRLKSRMNSKTTFVQYEQFYELMNNYKLKNKSHAFKHSMMRNDIDAIEHQKRTNFNMDEDELKFSTIHSFKGWEAHNAILVIEPEGRGDYCISSDDLNTPELIYTAITRAKESLFIINLGNTKYHSFFIRAINSKLN